jgi:hypothetical protein
MFTFAASFSGLMMVAEPETIVIDPRHWITPKYHRYNYEAACGSNVFQVRFGNDGKENGRVEHLLIDGRPIHGAAEMLQVRAARRLIMGIEILDCETDPQRSVLRGTINFEPGESRSLGMRWSLAFHLVREGRDNWRMTID